ncbi:MAG: phage antirepressor KilAC domain-containing protein [Clostridiales bacterium]|nr:phage antirepressor KilAC domain-containing protein [Clostridiales bacterium]
MSSIELFRNESFGEIRILLIEDEVWFVGKDVAEALGYERPDNAIRNHIDEEDKLMHQISASGQSRKMVIINESGLYSLILSSKLPQAKEFKRWVTNDILPSIRKNGEYISNQENLTQEEILAKALIVAQNVINEKDKLNKQLQAQNSELAVDNQIMRPKADYFDELVDRNLLTNFRETAKQLGIKEKLFIKFLLDKKYLYRDNRGKLMPYADKNNGLFEMKESVNEKTKWAGTQTLITPKGRETFRLLFI